MIDRWIIGFVWRRWRYRWNQNDSSKGGAIYFRIFFYWERKENKKLFDCSSWFFFNLNCFYINWGLFSCFFTRELNGCLDVLIHKAIWNTVKRDKWVSVSIKKKLEAISLLCRRSFYLTFKLFFKILTTSHFD